VIRRLLIANRGEIARRIIATCRHMGIATVAVYSDADADAPHVAEADLAVRLPGAAPADTYLRADLLVAAARATAADAVHPGYGFLAENAAFAAAVVEAGLTWVGPPPAAIAAMGSKVGAKALLGTAGVPMLASWTKAADVTAFPVLVKASAGGGGRGMRVVNSRKELADAMAAASREALAAFGDGTVFCERYIPRGRHIEVQILADEHGHVVALGERECSIQRRHQKIVEETPSPAIDERLRGALFDAAVTAARAVDYVGAGTVEFLLDPDSGEFAFLEMNTRLQVEHPVTECVTGLDLVRLQLEIAEGEPLPFSEPPPVRGHAIEVRLYAEEPAHDWRPSVGTLHRFDIPHRTSFAPVPEAGIRLDSAVIDGSVVSPHYDPMLAKVVAWAPTRAQAARLLDASLVRARLHGVVTNRDLLVRVLRDPEFLAGGTDTAFLDRHPEVRAGLLSTVDLERAALAAALVAGVDEQAPWRALPAGWRNVVVFPQHARFAGSEGTVEVAYRLDRTGALAFWSVDGSPGEPTVLLRRAANEVVLEVAGVRRMFTVNRAAGVSYVDFETGSAALVEVPRFAPATTQHAAGSLLAPMPGSVGRIEVAVGDVVKSGDLLLTLEAMKMEHTVRAPEAGVVTELRVRAGEQVEPGTLLAVITAESERNGNV
jgi:propionyl-CoA carboxylase alpha chain